jgi:hypothetical protein
MMMAILFYFLNKIAPKHHTLMSLYHHRQQQRSPGYGLVEDVTIPT